MHPDTRRILNDPALLAARRRWFARLGERFAGQDAGAPFYLYGVRGQATADPYREPELWVEQALDDLASRAERLLDERVFRPLVIEFGLFGVHFIDRMFGAEVFDLGPQWNWQAHYLRSPIGGLQPPDLARDETWGLAQRLAHAFLAADVALPLFGLPTIASPLNIAVNLYGDAILAALYEDPDAARHDLRVITDLLCTLHRWCLAHIPPAQLQPVIGWARTQPPGFGQICGCTTALLSPRLYRQFVAPLDDEVLSVYPHGGMVHLCGAHVQHIPAWREMRSLRAVQVNDRAAEDLAAYQRDLRPDQVLYVNPCQGMTARQALAVTGGQRTVVVAEPDG